MVSHRLRVLVSCAFLAYLSGAALAQTLPVSEASGDGEQVLGDRGGGAESRPTPAVPVHLGRPTSLQVGLPAVTSFGSIPDRDLRTRRYQASVRATTLLPPGACAVEDAHFRTEEGGCKDLITGLVWGQMSNGYPDPSVERDEAIAFCDALVEDGYDDWFLPSKDELMELAEHEGTDSGDAWHLNWTPTTGYGMWSTSKRGNKYWMVDVAAGNPWLVLEGSIGWFVCARIGGSDPGGGATAVHVHEIALSTQNAGQGQKRGRAQVTVLDDLGAPTQGVQITGTFTGDYAETVVATTDSNGVAVLTTTGTAQGGISFGFCVDDVAIAGLAYDDGANVETCDTF